MNAEWVSPHPPDHPDPRIDAVIKLLDRWLELIETGKAELVQPDPHYQRRGGKPPWTEEEINHVIETIDLEVDRELVWARTNQKMQKQAGPDFKRLGMPQKIALVQQIDHVLATVPSAAVAPDGSEIQN